MGLTKEIICPYCKNKEMPINFAIDMLRNYNNEIVTLNQCNKCKGIWTE